MEKEPQFFKVETDGPIIIWKFHNPPKNLRNGATDTEFSDLVEAFYDNPDLRVGIVTSALPDVFIQHYDVSQLVTLSEALQATPVDRSPRPAAQRPTPRGIYRCGPKPVICAMNALVTSGGCELALACDFRFMSRAAMIGLLEVHAGILPPEGTQRMTRLLGTARALEMILLGKLIDADEAERIGLIHRACDPEELMPAALEFAKELAARPPLAVALIKRCIYEGSEMSLKEGLALAYELFFEATKSDDALRLMRAYVAGGQNIERLSSEGGEQQ